MALNFERTTCKRRMMWGRNFWLAVRGRTQDAISCLTCRTRTDEGLIINGKQNGKSLCFHLKPPLELEKNPHQLELDPNIWHRALDVQKNVKIIFASSTHPRRIRASVIGHPIRHMWSIFPQNSTPPCTFDKNDKSSERLSWVLFCPRNKLSYIVRVVWNRFLSLKALLGTRLSFHCNVFKRKKLIASS